MTGRVGRQAIVVGAWGAVLLTVTWAAAQESAKTPPGGTGSWEIQGPEEIVTFLLFDPSAAGVSLPAGLRFVSARDAQMPQVLEYLKLHPEHSGWAFSFIEITRQKAFLIDGKTPALPENGGIGLWFAPVDPSQLAAEITKEKFDSVIAPSLGAVLGLGIWIPDREFVAYMRARGHHAEYGMVTLVKDSAGAFQGEIRLDDLNIRGSATPRGEVQEDPSTGTQVLFAPGEDVVHAVVLAGANARHRTCTAEWSKTGNHPLSHGVFVGPTYLTTYEAPLKGSVYRLQEAKTPPAGQVARTAPEKPKIPSRAELEKQFEEELTGATLNGVWQMTGEGGLTGKSDLTPPKPDLYVISKVAKVSEDYWLITARIKYADKDVNIPVPVRVVWAEDTAVITLNDLTMPLLGTYSARVMIHHGFYSGVWYCGEKNYGGVMQGRITKKLDDAPNGAKRTTE